MRYRYLLLLCLITIGGVACQQVEPLADTDTADKPPAAASPQHNSAKKPEGAAPGAMWVLDPCDDHDCGQAESDIETEEDRRYSLPPRSD